VRIVERGLQQLHQAPLTARVGAHDVRLAAADRENAFVVGGVVVPRLAGGPPAALHPFHHLVDRQLLEHQLDAPPAYS
jgi:hypothetical protein